MQLKHAILLAICVTLVIGSTNFLMAANVTTKQKVTQTQYLTQGFFLSKPMAVEGDSITFHIRAISTGSVPTGKLIIINSTGKIIKNIPLTFIKSEKLYNTQFTWRPTKNGLYSAKAFINGAGCTFENTQSKDLKILVPVITKDRELFFPWYKQSNYLRWITVSTSTSKEAVPPLRERGIKALSWGYAGMSLVHEDWMKSGSPQEIDKWFTESYGNGLVDTNFDGMGLDECGGYPGTREEESSSISLEVLARLRKDPKYENAFVAVWNGGMLRPDRAHLCRNACDLLLLETYVFGAMPGWLNTENTYAMIDDRVMAGARGTDILLPSYGKGCTTIQCIDIVGAPAKMHIGEIEQVVRYMRRIMPEMRGLGFYNCPDFPEGSTPEKIEILEKFGDEICLKYFIKPVITLMKNSLWVEKGPDGKAMIAVGVSNIGAMDSGRVIISLYDNGRKLGQLKTEMIPAGSNSFKNRSVLNFNVVLKPGHHTLEAIVDKAPDSTVLDSYTTTDWYWQP